MSHLVVENIGKTYRSFHSEWHRFARWFGIPIQASEENWVLRNVSFSIYPGEALGIIGQNGAGKSTLLKLITGILQPSEGRISGSGRISAILELGLGFNREMTGRQNVFHAAGLMGARAQEIQTAMPSIESFAEIGHYFDEPVRTYSSGMQARLAFSVATAFRPDILIVDEVLAVGDTYFMHKCTQRIREFQQFGTSLIVVAHDRAAIQTLCDRAILLDKGTPLMEGAPETVLDFYNALIAERESSSIQQKELPDGRIQTLSGSGEASVIDIRLTDTNRTPMEHVSVGQDILLSFEILLKEDLPELVFGYLIKDRLGHFIFGTNTFHQKLPLENLKKGERLHLQFSFRANLGVGSYSISTALHTGDNHVAENFEWRELALVFNVYNAHQPEFVGVNWMPPTITLLR